MNKDERWVLINKESRKSTRINSVDFHSQLNAHLIAYLPTCLLTTVLWEVYKAEDADARSSLTLLKIDRELMTKILSESREKRIHLSPNQQEWNKRHANCARMSKMVNKKLESKSEFEHNYE